LVEIFDFGLADLLCSCFNKRLHKLGFAAVLSPDNQSIKRLSNRGDSLYVSWPRENWNNCIFHLGTVSNVDQISESLFWILIKVL
jgi:hypothetical protein